MIDISKKESVERIATAEGRIVLGKNSIENLRKTKKGDALLVAEVAGILAVKKCPETIPHCHQIPIEGVSFSFSVKGSEVRVQCTVKSRGKTGVEMEALLGVSTALLTIWDMVKMYEKDSCGQYPKTEIKGIRVTRKVKGNGV
jgi:cyclic pyranopterin phosphate synthase